MGYMLIAIFATYAMVSLIFMYERNQVLEDIQESLDDLASIELLNRGNEIKCREIKNGKWVKDNDEPYI